MSIDLKYQNLLRKILDEGIWRENRTGIKALTIPHYHIEHDMSEGFPLLTTKKMSLRSIAVELEGFLKGMTDKTWYKERKCTIWNEWANPIAVKQTIDSMAEYEGDADLHNDIFVKREIQCTENDLGPIYGYQWRSFNKTYKQTQNEDDGDYSTYTDQLKTIIETINKNPNDRRMVCSAWNPNQMSMMALPPCHILWKVNILGDKLHLCWFQRSCDTALGIPYNIASYALLQTLLCKNTGYKPGKLSGFLDDVHIYENHLDGVRIQLERNPYKLPTLDIAHYKPFELINNELMINWTYKDIALFDYVSHDSIKFDVAI